MEDKLKFKKLQQPQHKVHLQEHFCSRFLSLKTDFFSITEMGMGIKERPAIDNN